MEEKQEIFNQNELSENLTNNNTINTNSEISSESESQGTKNQGNINIEPDDKLGNLLCTIVKNLVLDHDKLEISKCDPSELEPEMQGIETYNVKVSESDMGRIIGKNGKTARSLRSVMRSAAIKNGLKVDVRIGQ